MVEQVLNLDLIFASLADPTRRDILRRVSVRELSVGDIAQHYTLTFAAISKHLKVLEKARLIIKQRKGKEQIIRLSPQALAEAQQYLQQYAAFMAERYDALEQYLNEENHHGPNNI